MSSSVDLNILKPCIRHLSGVINPNILSMFSTQFPHTHVHFPLATLIDNCRKQLEEAQRNYQSQRATLEEKNIQLLVPPIRTYLAQVLKESSKLKWNTNQDSNGNFKLDLLGIVSSIERLAPLNTSGINNAETIDRWIDDAILHVTQAEDFQDKAKLLELLNGLKGATDPKKIKVQTRAMEKLLRG